MEIVGKYKCDKLCLVVFKFIRLKLHIYFLRKTCLEMSWQLIHGVDNIVNSTICLHFEFPLKS